MDNTGAHPDFRYSGEELQGEQFAYFAVKLGFDPWQGMEVKDQIYMEFAAFRTLMISEEAVGCGFDNITDALWFLEELDMEQCRLVMDFEGGELNEGLVPPSYRDADGMCPRVHNDLPDTNLDSDDDREGPGPQSLGFQETKEAYPEDATTGGVALPVGGAVPGPTVPPSGRSEEAVQAYIREAFGDSSEEDEEGINDYHTFGQTGEDEEEEEAVEEDAAADK